MQSFNLTKIYLTKKFEEYYSDNDIELPDRFQNREFAFVPFELLPDFVMFRHISFRSYDEFRNYILTKIPAHIYYSSAYYERPDEDRMDRKGWIGAELIFDIDADHLPVKTTFENSLKIAKREVKKLMILLKRDFGVRDAKIYFSGGRGYHVHVCDDEFLQLSSAERREIVDYLSLNSPTIVVENSISNSNAARRVIKYIKQRLKKSEDLLKKYRLKKDDVDVLDRQRISRAKKIKRVIEELSGEAVENLRIYIDAPVTADVKRLIRMPGSLHGKTGLKVVEVEDLQSFEPLRDAIAFGENLVKVRCLRKVRLKIGDIKLKLSSGETTKIPEYAAIFLLCRGDAIYYS
jgi:DNA primase small subunit